MQLGSKVYNDIEAVITRVIDGDTVEATVDCLFDIKQSNVQIRLYGIDTAELTSTNPDKRILAQRAKARLTDLVLNKPVKLTSRKVVDPDLDTDKYGRYLATIFIGTMNVNDTLLKEGLAVEYFGGKK